MTNTFSKLIRLQKEILSLKSLPHDFHGYLLSLFSKMYDLSQAHFLMCFESDSPFLLIDAIGLDHQEAQELIPNFDLSKNKNQIKSEYGNLDFKLYRLHALDSDLVLALSFPEDVKPESYSYIEILTQVLEQHIDYLSLLKKTDLLNAQKRLNDLIKSIEPSQEIDFIEKSCPLVSDFLNAERTTFYIYNKETNTLEDLWAEGLGRTLEINLKPGEGLVGACYAQKKPLFTNQPYQSDEFEKKIDQQSGYVTKSILVSPIFRDQEVLGVLQILNKRSQSGFDENDIQSIQIVADTLSSHISLYSMICSHFSSKIELDSILENMPDVVYKLDEEGCFTFISEEVSKWGYHKEDLLGKHYSNLLHEEDYFKVSRDHVLPNYVGVVTGDKAAPGLFDERRQGDRATKKTRVRIQPGKRKALITAMDLDNPQGSIFYTEVNAGGFWIKDHRFRQKFLGTIGIIRDITAKQVTEEKLIETQDELIQAEKFAGLGTLAAGIAHDFNNILAAINFSTDISLLLLEKEEKSPLHTNLESKLNQILENVTKASDLTSRLFSLGKSDGSKLEMTPIDDVIRDAVGIIHDQIIEKKIKLSLDLDPGIPSSRMDKSQIRDVIVNLITNSMHSMQEHCESSGDPLNEMEIKVSSSFVKRNIILKFKDTGTGIPKEILPKIFDPFFTTKDRDSRKGTGLGLAMVFSVVQNHGGKVSIDTVTQETIMNVDARFREGLKTGTTFTIKIPLEQRRVRKMEPSLQSDDNLNKSTVYIVDDEDFILDHLYSILTKEGFTRVSKFSNGASVVEAMEKAKQLPHVIFTDINMPPLDGLALAKMIYRIPKNERPLIVAVSGKLTPEYIQTFKTLGVKHFIHKPFTKEQITESLYECLSNHPGVDQHK
ncbi:MAG: response regulator [Candidatus Cloacimonetes bacterium]|nr:response regulator [Candidatus Cloacimonadota bacterium]